MVSFPVPLQNVSTRFLSFHSDSLFPRTVYLWSKLPSGSFHDYYNLNLLKSNATVAKRSFPGFHSRTDPPVFYRSIRSASSQELFICGTGSHGVASSTTTILISSNLMLRWEIVGFPFYAPERIHPCSIVPFSSRLRILKVRIYISILVKEKKH